MQYAISRLSRKIIASWNGDIFSSGCRSPRSATKGTMSGTATRIALNPSMSIPMMSRKMFITMRNCQRWSTPTLTIVCRSFVGTCWSTT